MSHAATALQQRPTAASSSPSQSQNQNTSVTVSVISKRTPVATVANSNANGNDNDNGISSSGRDEENQQLIDGDEASSRKNYSDDAAAKIGADDASDTSEGGVLVYIGWRPLIRCLKPQL